MDWEDKNASLSLESTENPTHLLLKLAIGDSGEQSLKSVQRWGHKLLPVTGSTFLESLFARKLRKDWIKIANKVLK